ncbi:MAG: alpha/beta hydrolase [Myxococcota bacterium]|nr:alpha/beta hydrolase [Myxococcota bacterium]
MQVDAAQFRPEAIDDETREANATLEALLAGAPSVLEHTPREIRDARERGESVFGPIQRLDHAATRAIPGPSGDLRLRVLRPASETRGVYLHLHGGGWTLGAEDQQDALLNGLARDAGLAVASLGYRLAPENPYPAAPDDCEAAALWLIEHAGRLLGSDRLLIGGESAGAHLAAVTLLRLRDRHGEVPFLGANLVYGCYDLTLTPSARSWGERNLVLSTPIIEWFADHFVPDPTLRRHPDVSPLHAALHGLPPALFTVGTLDPLVDDSLFMAARWEAAAGRAELAVHPGGVHGFTLFPTRLAEEAHRRQIAFIRSCLEDAT